MSKITEFVKGHSVKDIYYAKANRQSYLVIEFESEQDENPCIKIPVEPNGRDELGMPFLESFPVSIDLIGG